MDFFLFQKGLQSISNGFQFSLDFMMYFQLHLKAKSFVCVSVNLKTYIKSSLPVLYM